MDEQSGKMEFHTVFLYFNTYELLIGCDYFSFSWFIRQYSGIAGAGSGSSTLWLTERRKWLSGFPCSSVQPLATFGCQFSIHGFRMDGHNCLPQSTAPLWRQTLPAEKNAGWRGAAMMSKRRHHAFRVKSSFHNSLFRKGFRVAAQVSKIDPVVSKGVLHESIIQIAGSCGSLLLDLFLWEIW